jgi:dihydroorotate dehydrogenase
MSPGLASRLGAPLRRLDPERAHRIGLALLRAGVAGSDRTPADAALAVSTLGLDFPNPIGLAAGFDKDAGAIGPLLRLGFGFVEAGTVTPRAQTGNPRPRLFRLPEDQAVINRLGFNNAGLDPFLARLRRLPPRSRPLGANIGINRDGAVPELDYPALAAAIAPHVDYLTINVSSPNTPGLRDLQSPGRISGILQAIAAAVPRHPPLLVKIAPDLPDVSLADLVEACVGSGAAGLIVSNTTTSRPAGLRSPHRIEAGGLSGAPLFDLSTAMLARAALLARGRLVLIGVGGVATGAQALRKLQAGASLVQLYTGFAYHGPGLIPRLKAELLACLRAQGYPRVTDAIGTHAETLAGAAACNT